MAWLCLGVALWPLYYEDDWASNDTDVISSSDNVIAIAQAGVEPQTALNIKLLLAIHNEVARTLRARAAQTVLRLPIHIYFITQLLYIDWISIVKGYDRHIDFILF